ncbi:MAG: hypothetical protein QM793_00980 [Muricomes sp.]
MVRELGMPLIWRKFFLKNVASEYQVFAVHNEGYYQTMIFEQMSVNGGVKLMRQDGHIVGMFAYAIEGHVEIREAVSCPNMKKTFRKRFMGSGQAVKNP